MEGTINGKSTSSPPHIQKLAKEILEVVDTDPSKRMSECSLGGDSKILINSVHVEERFSNKGSNLQDNAECSSLKKKEKKNKKERKHNYVQSDVIEHDRHDTPINNSPMEINSQSCGVVGTNVETYLETTEFVASIPPSKKKRRRRSKHDRVNMNSLVSNTVMQIDSSTQPLDDTCLDACGSVELDVDKENVGERGGSDGELASEESKKKSSYVDPASMERKKGSEMGSSRQVIDKSCVGASGSSNISCEDHDKKIVEIRSRMKNANDVGLGIKQKDSWDIYSSPEKVLTFHLKKKLLILDVNGILCDIGSYVPHGYQADIIIGRKTVFKRPFCDNFLQFCFERFNVGVWSSRNKRNVEGVIDFLLGNTKHNLLFCWDQSHCTNTGYNTVENRDKPLLLKELQKVWEKCEANLPWKRGEYNESNTLLLDDSPYKALCNPVYTAIFPYSYRYEDLEDNSLGPEGDLRVYLEGLSLAENVQKYVELNPFGQRPITENNLCWSFYLSVINAVSSQRKFDSRANSRN